MDCIKWNDSMYKHSILVFVLFFVLVSVLVPVLVSVLVLVLVGHCLKIVFFYANFTFFFSNINSWIAFCKRINNLYPNQRGSESHLTQFFLKFIAQLIS